MNNIINLISLNTNQEFVNQFFDTDIYKKQVFCNPQLLKETKSNLVYICEDNKKLTIPKLYENMGTNSNDNKEHSILVRIFMKSLIIFGIFFLFSMIDLWIGNKNNSKYLSNINDTCETIQTNLDNYGYTITNDCNFKKTISNNQISTIQYNINKKGTVTDTHLELYYDASTYSENELRDIIHTLNTDFSDNEINHFIEQVNSCINGTCSYTKIESSKNRLRIGSSNGLINIHNY